MGIILTGAGVSCPALMCLWYDDFIITGTELFSSLPTPARTYNLAVKSWTNSLTVTSSLHVHNVSQRKWELLLLAEGVLHWNTTSDVSD